MRGFASPLRETRILAHQVREKSHEAGALDRERELPLVPTTDTGTLAWHNLPERRQITAQGVGVLVVNVGSIDLAEVAGARLLQFGVLRIVHRSVHDEALQPVRVRDE